MQQDRCIFSVDVTDGVEGEASQIRSSHVSCTSLYQVEVKGRQQYVTRGIWHAARHKAIVKWKKKKTNPNLSFVIFVVFSLSFLFLAGKSVARGLWVALYFVLTPTLTIEIMIFGWLNGQTTWHIHTHVPTNNTHTQTHRERRKQDPVKFVHSIVSLINSNR